MTALQRYFIRSLRCSMFDVRRARDTVTSLCVKLFMHNDAVSLFLKVRSNAAALSGNKMYERHAHSCVLRDFLRSFAKFVCMVTSLRLVKLPLTKYIYCVSFESLVTSLNSYNYILFLISSDYSSEFLSSHLEYWSPRFF